MHSALFATGHFPLLFLVAGLFFPRLTLFVAWLISAYPPNTLAVLLNVVLWVFVPRFLIAIYLYLDVGANNIWFLAYLITGIVGLFGEPAMVRRRVIRRRVIRDGSGSTVVEEEEI